ncbi:MAG: hypothetical protein OHK0038_26340 [Flammeovirgaceae bacterium]
MNKENFKAICLVLIKLYKKLKIKLLFFLIFYSFLSFAQNIERVKSNIDTLCSEEMFGRGYTQGGDTKAAHWISAFYQRINLKNFNNSYFQKFPLEVNLFDNELVVKLDKQLLKVGEDFLPQSHSGSGKGTSKPVLLDERLFSDKDFQQNFLKMDLKGVALIYPNEWNSKIMSLPENLLIKFFEADLHVATVEKLTHSLSWEQFPTPSLLVLRKHLTTLPKKIHFDIKANLKQTISQNVVGFVRGTLQPDSFLVFTAHYDHLGGIGKDTYFAGANDNASGVAMLLELADYFSQHPQPYSVAFIAFSGEEAGLIGSRFYVEYPLFPLSQIKWLMNLDLIATGEKGATIVNGAVFKEEFDELVNLNKNGSYLPAILSRGKAANSDHYFFSEKGGKSFFMYLMGDWTNYHDIYDKPPVPLTKFKETFQLLVDFVEK